MGFHKIFVVICCSAVVFGNVREDSFYKIEFYIGKFKKVECEKDDSIFSPIYSCYVRPVNRTTSLMQLKFNAVANIEKLLLSFQFFKKETMNFQPFPISFKKINYCEFLKTGKTSKLSAKIIINYSQQYINLRECPIQGNIEFKEFNFVPDFFPSVWPRGYYKAEFNFYKNSI